MNVGKRHRRAPQLGRLFALMSVIALALACSPALAQAECTSSSCVQYTESIPKPEGENAPPHQKTPAKASKTGDGGGSEPSQQHGSKDLTEADGSGEGEASEKEGAVAGGNGGGNGQGKPGSGAHAGGENAQAGAQNKSGVQASQSSDGGGSSPLVPILIAIAVLAAISVAVVMARQRRQRRGPTGTASPEAN
jgi:cobalamin biosynthesis Mg chelatase CobN